MLLRKEFAQYSCKIMNRKTFLKSLAILPIAGGAFSLFSNKNQTILNTSILNDLNNTLEDTGTTMPVLFVGHGSPMNAIEENEFSKKWQEIGKKLPKPKVILCVSAHWETKGTFVTAMPKPRTIHDFGGFPQSLFDVQYGAPGSIEFAKLTKETIKKAEVGLDEAWGLDHGCWSILKHLYPNADVPVLQLSLDYQKDAQYHYDLAKELAPLRKKGVLILSSGNIVHNLGKIAWDKINTPDYGFDWAIEANTKMKKFILDNDSKSLIDYKGQGKSFELAIPSPEHYLPLLYTMALKTENEKTTLFNDKALMGSLTMTSVMIES